MTKLILHAGFHKTGTTAIQGFAAKNRAALAKQGIFYPDYRPVKFRKPEAHHDLAHTIAGRGRLAAPGEVRKLLRRWAQAADSAGRTVFLSSESICRHVDEAAAGGWHDKRRAYLEKLADVLSSFDVTAVLVLRRQDDYLESRFKEHVMKNTPAGRRKFKTFRKNFEKNKLDKGFLANLLLFKEMFADLRPLVYEDLVKGRGLCRNFFDSFGVDASGMRPVGVVRKGLGVREVMLKIFLNEGIGSKDENKRVLSWLRGRACRELLDRYCPERGIGLWESQEARRGFIARFDDENRKIHELFFPERKEALFPPPAEDFIQPAPPLPDRVKAETVREIDRLNCLRPQRFLAHIPFVRKHRA